MRMYQDRCEECRAVIPSEFNNDEAIQFCPKCQLKREHNERDYTAMNDTKQARFASLDMMLSRGWDEPAFRDDRVEYIGIVQTPKQCAEHDDKCRSR